MQLAAPVALEYWPLWQLSQTASFITYWYLPEEHAAQFVDPVPAVVVVYLPCGQPTQRELPGLPWYELALQAVQPGAPVAPA